MIFPAVSVQEGPNEGVRFEEIDENCKSVNNQGWCWQRRSSRFLLRRFGDSPAGWRKAPGGWKAFSGFAHGECGFRCAWIKKRQTLRTMLNKFSGLFCFWEDSCIEPASPCLSQLENEWFSQLVQEHLLASALVLSVRLLPALLEISGG